jgi:scyllo-inositol 2-dehydrogenase (NADP+)
VRVIIVGLGIQGAKRKQFAGADVIATVDPVHPSADYTKVEDVPLDAFDAALLCIPDDPKVKIIEYLLSSKKHVLVEKPLFATDNKQLYELKALSERNSVTCYTAYNHRFEPHILSMKRLIASGLLGKVYSARIFYGNGTARLVKDSVWRDTELGVLSDLGSHLLDIALFWFGGNVNLSIPRLYAANCFENRTYDHVLWGIGDHPKVNMEVSLLSWKNHFSAEILAENGSAHIDSLCKWGPSTFTIRTRKLPSGKPDEKSKTLTQSDPTWSLEYRYFSNLCKSGMSNLNNDIWINQTLTNLKQQLGAEETISGRMIC